MKRFLGPAVVAATLASAAQASALVDPASGATIALAPDSAMHRTLAACTGDALVLVDGATKQASARVAMRCGRGGPARVDGGIAVTGEDASGPALLVVGADGRVASRTAIDRAPVGRPAPSPDGAALAIVSGSGALYLVAPSGAVIAQLDGVAPAATDAREAWRGREAAWCWSGDGYVAALAGATGPMAYDAAGRASRAYATQIESATARPTCADLDGDGIDELLWPAGGAVSALSVGGEVRWRAALPSGAAIEAPVTAVSTASGPRLLAANGAGWLTALDAHGAVVDGFPRRVPARVRVEPLVADADGDATLDVLVADASGGLAAFALSDGHATIDRAAWLPAEWIAATPVIVDADGDGLSEVVAIDARGAYAARPLAATALATNEASPWPGAGGTLDGAGRHALAGGPGRKIVPVTLPASAGVASGDPSASSTPIASPASAAAGNAACGCTNAGARAPGGFGALAFFGLFGLVNLARRRNRT